MAAFDYTPAQSPNAGTAGRIGTAIVAGLNTFNSWVASRQTRIELHKLSNQTLEDIGLSRADIERL